MNEFTLPEWLSVGTLGTVATAVLGVVFMFLKMTSTMKASKANGQAQLGLLETMASRLTDMKTITTALEDIVETQKVMQETLNELKTEQAVDMGSLAAYVNEAFQLSNLSDDKKTQLSVRLQELFAGSKDAVIEKLEKLTTEATLEIATANETIADLQAQLDKAKSVAAPVVTKKRRI